MSNRWLGLTVWLLLGFPIIGMAQGNLVPNWSFEIHLIDNNSSLYNAPPWQQLASADLFNPTNGPVFGAPLNIVGFQFALHDSSYAGVEIIATGIPNRREYVEVPLISELDSGGEYCVLFYISPGGAYKYTADRVGALFVTDSIITCYGCLVNLAPQIEFTQGIVSDTTNWTAVSGSFIANGNERYMVIGNFYPDSVTTVQVINSSSTSWAAYFYIDAVSVYKKLNANAGSDAIICSRDSIQLGTSLDSGAVYSWVPSTGLSDSTSSTPWAKPLVTTTYYLTISDTGNLYCTGNLVDSVTITVQDCTPPPPLNVPTILKSDELFFITSLPANSSLKIYDTRGRLILREENYQNDFSVINLDAAVYLYELTLPDLTVQKGKFCVVR